MKHESRRRSVQCLSPSGLHRIAYLEWGDPKNPRVVLCAHGLTRCARDFDNLAAALAGQFRVICPDTAGRGESDWLADPMLYQIPQYLADMVTLVARLDVSELFWVGTSMGGLIGMAYAGLPDSPLRKFVINDAGPVISKVALERIATYVGVAPQFSTFEAAEQYVRAVSASFGPHSDAEWKFLTEVVVRRQADGGWRMHYDPRLAEPFRKNMPERDLELWPMWDAVRCPTLLLRGENSDLLAPQTAAQMAARGPKAKVVEVTGVGHAPTLMHANQVAIVRDFLLAA